MRPALCRVLALLALGLMPATSTLAQQAPAPKLVAEGEARTPSEERVGFHLPEGFVIELVASEPAINKPMNIAFDDRGRLWVTSTVEYPYPVKDGAKSRDRVVILGDFADDGHARSISTFAENLNIPIGLLPLGRGDSALVHDIPNIRRFVDTDGDGKADKVEPAYEKYGFRDTHGMTNAFSWGFDGWIYACHGFSNESTVKGSDGKPIVMQSGNVYRMRPDGSHAEYYSHGQVNPFGLAFDPLGNLYSCDCHSKPLYQLLRGAFYPSFGKPDDGLGFGPTMIDHDHGSTGIGGIAFYAADHFPEAYRGTTFIGNVVTSRINHDQLAFAGSSPKAIEQPDFVVSDDPWFRPVDIELGPDGALYVADFYNRIIGHYEVPLDHPGRDRERGRIWRIVYKGKDGQGVAPKAPRPDLSVATVDELIADLGHANLAVRTIATNQLVLRGAEAIGALKGAVESATGTRKVHTLWALQRLGALDEATLKRASADPDEAVRIHALKILAERPTLPVGGLAAFAAADEPLPRVRRALAEAMGRHPSTDHIPALLAETARVEPADTHFQHVVKVALRDQLLGSDVWAYVFGREWSPAEEAALASAALGVPSPEAARFLVQHLPRAGHIQAEVIPAIRHAARHGATGTEAELVRFAREPRFEADPAARYLLLDAIQKGTQERGASVGPEVVALAADVARALLATGDEAKIKQGVGLAGSMKLAGLAPDLGKIVDDRQGSPARRVAALGALASVDRSGAVDRLGRLLRDPLEPLEVRERAGGLLVDDGRPASRALAVEALATAPARLQTAIATGLAQNKEGAEALLAAVAAGKSSARPLQEPGVATRLATSGIPDVKARLEALLKDLPPAEAKTQALIEKRKAGFLALSAADPARGASIFEKNCAACHQLEGQGARIGPQLDGVGLRGLDRLLEDTLDPNRNVDQAFRVTTLALTDGRVASGLLLRQDGEVLVLADAQGKDVRVPASAIEDRRLSQLSPMPASLGDQIDEADYYQLVAYLLSKKPKP
jgi:putative heme-binding domain-containing protein